MKLIWSPETASKAYIDTVKSCEGIGTPGAAELVAAMAAGWNANLIVETWSEGETIAISVGLNVASQHTNARHICIVPNAISQTTYLQAMTQHSCSNLPETIIINEEESSSSSSSSESTMQTLQGIDFLVIDWDQKDFAANVLRNAAFGSRGAVVVCRNGYRRSTSCFSWTKAFSDRKVVRTVTLPVSGGLEIAHVAAARSSVKSDNNNNKRKWIKHFDQRSGEEHVIRK